MQINFNALEIKGNMTFNQSENVKKRPPNRKIEGLLLDVYLHKIRWQKR